MHCPSCGTDTTLDQRFCRSCGMGLETVSKLVAEHSSSSPETLTLEKTLTRKMIQQRMYDSLKWGMISFIVGMAVLVLGNLVHAKSVSVIAMFLLFLAMGLMAYGVLSPMRDSSPASGKFPRPGPTRELPETEATKELPPTPVPVASITEHTTKLFVADDAVKRGQ